METVIYVANIIIVVSTTSSSCHELSCFIGHAIGYSHSLAITLNTGDDIFIYNIKCAMNSSNDTSKYKWTSICFNSRWNTRSRYFSYPRPPLVHQVPKCHRKCCATWWRCVSCRPHQNGLGYLWGKFRWAARQVIDSYRGNSGRDKCTKIVSTANEQSPKEQKCVNRAIVFLAGKYPGLSPLEIRHYTLPRTAMRW